MTLKDQLAQALSNLHGLRAPSGKTVAWSVADAALEIDFTAVDPLGCALRELRVSTGRLGSAPPETLRLWAENLARRVNYLLEPMRVLEADSAAASVLVRSMPPTRDDRGTTYYEALVGAPGTLSVRRYHRAPGNDARQQIDVQITAEVLLRLVGDIVDAIPESTAA